MWIRLRVSRTSSKTARIVSSGQGLPHRPLGPRPSAEARKRFFTRIFTGPWTAATITACGTATATMNSAQERLARHDEGENAQKDPELQKRRRDRLADEEADTFGLGGQHADDGAVGCPGWVTGLTLAGMSGEKAAADAADDGLAEHRAAVLQVKLERDGEQGCRRVLGAERQHLVQRVCRRPAR